MTNNNDELPPTIDVGNGVTMTFLRDQPYLTRVNVPADYVPPDEGKYGALIVFPHWHERHDEFFHVVEGRLEVTIGTETRCYAPEDGEIRIPKGVVHGLRSLKGEAVIFEESTDPRDDEKELFFRNILANGKMPTNPLEVMLIGHELDMRPGFPGHIMWLEKAFVSILGGFLAPLLGYKLAYPSLKKTN